MFNPSEQTVAGLLVLLADRGPWESAYWPHGGGRSCVRRGGATDCPCEWSWWKCFPRERSRSPAWWWWGRQKEDRSGFLRATSNRFPGKTHLHMQDSATSYLREHVRIEQMGHLFTDFCRKKKTTELHEVALYQILFMTRITFVEISCLEKYWWK